MFSMLVKCSCMIMQYYHLLSLVVDHLRKTDMAVFCLNEQSELIAFTESTVEQVSANGEFHPYL